MNNPFYFYYKSQLYIYITVSSYDLKMNLKKISLEEYTLLRDKGLNTVKNKTMSMNIHIQPLMILCSHQ
jgi:hypothetical protein